jgi:putative acetyltransferase
MLLVRAATTGDAEAIYDVHVAAIRDVCGPFYDPEQIAAWTANKEPSGYLEPIAKQVFLVGVMDEKVVGFGQLAADAGTVHAMYVRPDRIRQGIGSALLEAIEAAARDRRLARLDLRATINAVPFYERHGYVSDEPEVAVVRGGVRLSCVGMHKVIAR